MAGTPADGRGWGCVIVRLMLDVCLIVIWSAFTRIGFGSLDLLDHSCGSHVGYKLSHSRVYYCWQVSWKDPWDVPRSFSLHVFFPYFPLICELAF